MDEFTRVFAEKYLETLEVQNDLIFHTLNSRDAVPTIVAIQSAHIVQIRKCYMALSSALPVGSRPTFSNYLRSLADEHEKPVTN
jgi:hypothetical protein